jgi:hypothetical protein
MALCLIEVFDLFLIRQTAGFQYRGSLVLCQRIGLVNLVDFGTDISVV